MTRSGILRLALLTMSLAMPCALTASAGEEAATATAAEAAADFFGALASNDIGRAMALTAPVKATPPEVVRAYCQRLAEQMKRTGAARVVAHLAVEDAAVVVFREGGAGKDKIADLDPAYLVRRGGRWLVLYKLTRFDRPEHELDEASVRRFRRLEEWYREQKPKLQAILGDEDDGR